MKKPILTPKITRWEPPEYFVIACKKCNRSTFISMVVGSDAKEAYCPFCGILIAVEEKECKK